MLSKHSFKTERQSSLVEDSNQAVIGNGGGIKKNNQVAGVTGNETRIEQAEARAEQAEARTEQAKTRTELAETRTEQAETTLQREVQKEVRAR